MRMLVKKAAAVLVTSGVAAALMLGSASAASADPLVSVIDDPTVGVAANVLNVNALGNQKNIATGVSHHDHPGSGLKGGRS
ncbi:MAG: hypothetical protein ACRDTT_03750 [Pseudonocardiaceae bacterium]